MMSITLAAGAEITTFSTGSFVPSEFTSTVTGTGSATHSTQATGGNPDAYRRISLTVAPFQDVRDVQIWDTAAFTPATSGAVTSVALSYDIARISTSNPSANQITRGVAVQQDGIIHLHRDGVSTSTSFQPFSIADIVPLFPAINWTNGTQIKFGFYDDVTTSDEGFTLDGGYDNFAVTVNSTSVPDPSTAGVALGAVAYLGGTLRRRR